MALKVSHNCVRGGAVAAEETVGLSGKRRFEEVFWGLLEQKQAEKGLLCGPYPASG